VVVAGLVAPEAEREEPLVGFRHLRQEKKHLKTTLNKKLKPTLNLKTQKIWLRPWRRGIVVIVFVNREIMGLHPAWV
jgi:hypothetical protein